MRRRIAELLGGGDDIVWASLQTLATEALTASRLLEQRLHPPGGDSSRLTRELRGAAQVTDDALRHLNRHLHATFTAPLERDDALALATALDRVAQICADMGATLDARAVEQGRHEARRAASLVAGALERLVPALADLAAGRATDDAPGEARALIAEGREFVRQGLADVLSADLAAEQLLSWKDLYDRLDAALAAVRDVERLLDAMELRGGRG